MIYRFRNANHRSIAECLAQNELYFNMVVDRDSSEECTFDLEIPDLSPEVTLELSRYGMVYRQLAPETWLYVNPEVIRPQQKLPHFLLGL